MQLQSARRIGRRVQRSRKGKQCAAYFWGMQLQIARLLDVLAGEFRGRGKESNARHIIGECNYRLLDALAGEFRGRGKKSNARHIIGECNYRLLDALAGEFRGRVKRK